MTIKEIVNLNPSDYFYNFKDKIINYVTEKSCEQFDISDNLQNSTKDDMIKNKYYNKYTLEYQHKKEKYLLSNPTPSIQTKNKYQKILVFCWRRRNSAIHMHNIR